MFDENKNDNINDNKNENKNETIKCDNNEMDDNCN